MPRAPVRSSSSTSSSGRAEESKWLSGVSGSGGHVRTSRLQMIAALRGHLVAFQTACAKE